jgi:signal peptidase I
MQPPRHRWRVAITRPKDTFVSSSNSDGPENAGDTENPISKGLKSINNLVGGIWTLIYAALIAVSIRTFAYEPFNIPSGSMLPTLLIGDYLFVSKFSYGYSRYSIPLGLPLFEGRIMSTPLHRGDVAVFKKPGEEDIDYIKRIVGVPGDRIQMIDGVFHLNGSPVARKRVEDFAHVDRQGNHVRTPQYRETLPDGTTYMTLDAVTDGPADNTPVFLVPKGFYFAMGDNRDNSLDSRIAWGIGFIPEENLVGRAEVLFFSVNGESRFWELWRWPDSIRYSRFFDSVG